MSFFKALHALGGQKYGFDGEDPTNETEYLAGLRITIDDEERTVSEPDVAWRDIEAEMVRQTITSARLTVDGKHAESLRLLTGDSGIEERYT